MKPTRLTPLAAAAVTLLLLSPAGAWIQHYYHITPAPAAEPASSGAITATSPSAYEGRDLTFTFTSAVLLAQRVCYKYTTHDGTASAQSFGVHPDYDEVTGTLCFRGTGPAETPVVVTTYRDSVCEHDETVQIRVWEPSTKNVRNGVWVALGHQSHWPYEIMATGTIRQHETGCQAQQFGE